MGGMLGRTGPFDPRSSCCSRHGGPENMTPKRAREREQWMNDFYEEDEDVDELLARYDAGDKGVTERPACR